MKQRAASGGVTVLSLLGGIVLWEIVGRISQTRWFPPLSEVLSRIGSLWAQDRLQSGLAASVTDLVVGYAIGASIGLCLGFLMAFSLRAEWGIRPYVDAMLMVPPIIMAPIFLVVIGLSQATLIAIVVVFTAPGVATNTQTAVSNTDWHLRQMAASFGASRWQIVSQVSARDAAPLIMTALYLGMSRAVKGMIIGELFIAVAGVGKLEEAFQSTFDATGIWAVTVVVLGIALVAMSAVRLVDNRINWWKG